MTTLARISATKAAAVYTATISGATTFAAIDLVGGEDVLIEVSDSSGGYHPLKYLDGAGNPRQAQLNFSTNTIVLTGGDIRISKPPTQNSVEIVQYT